MNASKKSNQSQSSLCVWKTETPHNQSNRCEYSNWYLRFCIVLETMRIYQSVANKKKHHETHIETKIWIRNVAGIVIAVPDICACALCTVLTCDSCIWIQFNSIHILLLYHIILCKHTNRSVYMCLWEAPLHCQQQSNWAENLIGIWLVKWKTARNARLYWTLRRWAVTMNALNIALTGNFFMLANQLCKQSFQTKQISKI